MLVEQREETAGFVRRAHAALFAGDRGNLTRGP
jgi:hypothetical protein